MKSTLPFPSGDTAGNFSHERCLYEQGLRTIAGCDEVGRGPLAGPVLAACVILPSDCDHSIFKDSKALSHARRVKLAKIIKEITGNWAIGIASPEEIDEINILQASLLAMKRAVLSLPLEPADFLLVDGKFQIPLSLPQLTLIKGESKSSSIAAASILAKVARDKIMEKYHEKYPLYGFNQHKGYPTRHHREAIREHGPCSIHRLSFRGVRENVK